MNKFFLLLISVSAFAHSPISTKITWSKEISRIVYQRCLFCHREDGKAFSLESYEEARPWAKAIQEEVLTRRMPPWGAVKGFGEFTHDQGLTQEEVNLIAEWVEGGAPEGDPNLLPSRPRRFPDPPAVTGKPLKDTSSLQKAVRLTAIQATGTTQVTAEFPDGHIEPLLWTLHPSAEPRTFILRHPLTLPKGSRIHSSAPVTVFATKPARQREK